MYGGGRGQEPPDDCVDANGKRPKAKLCAGQDLLSVYDLNSNTLLPLQAAGEAPTPRSSHRSVTLTDRMVFYGGAVQGEGLSTTGCFCKSCRFASSCM